MNAPSQHFYVDRKSDLLCCVFLLAGKSPYLMFTNRHEIRRIDLVKRDYTQVVPTQKNAVALDVDVASNRMFWCDRFHRRIYR